MTDIRQRLRMLADNAQRSAIVEEAIRLIDSKDDGVGLIAAERQRQVAEEGWNSSHDDEHGNYELVSAACCYAKQAYLGDINPKTIKVPMGWPWDEKWWKPSSRIRMLVKAGALIAAEIDRALRQLGREAKEATPAGKVNMDLPIKVLSRDEVDVADNCYSRQGILRRISTLKELDLAAEALGWREILRMMDEFKEESSSFISPSCLSKNHHICEQEGCTCGCHGEPTKWEPGILAIFKDGRTVVRLEREIEPDLSTWWVTDMQDGTEYEQGLGFGGWRVHRRPHEFKVGDWFEWHWPGGKVGGTERVVDFESGYVSWRLRDGITMSLRSKMCRHVPPPREQPRKEALGDLARQEQSEGKYRCDLPNEKEVMPNATRSDNVHVHGMPDRENAVTGAHRAGKTSERFSGPHWYALDLAIAQYEKSKSPEVSILMYPLLRERDLRDAWLEKEGK